MGKIYTHLVVYYIYTTQYPKQVRGTPSREKSKTIQKIPSSPTHRNPHSFLNKCYHRNRYGLSGSFLMPLPQITMLYRHVTRNPVVLFERR